MSLALDSREAVDAMIKAAAANGGTAHINPVHEHGFVYARDLADPDGHIWGPLRMDMAAMPTG